MPLHSDLRVILKNELFNDPRKMGYSRYWNNHAQLCAMLNNPRRKSVIIEKPITSARDYLIWLQNTHTINNVHLAIELVDVIAAHSSSGAVDALIGSETTLQLLNVLTYYGIDTFLNMFGITSYWGDKELLKTTLLQILEHAANIGAAQYSAQIQNEYLPPRITILFRKIPGAPNAVTESDIQEAQQV